jgi:hypothetical protein
MEEIWIARLEVIALLDSARDLGQAGYTNVVCSGSDRDAVELKVRDCLTSYGWQILNIENISAVHDDLAYSDEICELIDDVRQNSHHIRLATLHTYKVN